VSVAQRSHDYVTDSVPDVKSFDLPIRRRGSYANVKHLDFNRILCNHHAKELIKFIKI
jgi:hypothetical protein